MARPAGARPTPLTASTASRPQRRTAAAAVGRRAVAPYAERASSLPGAFDLGLAQAFGTWSVRRLRRGAVEAEARAVRDIAAGLAGLGDVALLAEAAALRPALLRDGKRLLPHAFALAHVAVERHLGLRYHAVQLAGGRALTGRRIVEMATGEGKTITAMLPAVRRRAGGAAGACRHGQRLPRRARRRADCGRLCALWACRAASSCTDDAPEAARGLCRRRHLLHQQGTGLRLPA